MNCKNKTHSCNSCGERKCGNKHNCHSADTVEVVRCKDCIHRVEQSKMCAHPKAIGWDAIEPEDDDFCSYGERKQNEQR